MDPYQQQVTQQALQEYDRQGAMAQNKLAGQAVKGGVFGGSRYGIAEGQLDADVAGKIGQAQAQGYTQA